MEEKKRFNYKVVAQPVKIEQPQLDIKTKIVAENEDMVTVQFTINIIYHDNADDYILDYHIYDLNYDVQSFKATGLSRQTSFDLTFKEGEHGLAFKAIFTNGIEVVKAFNLIIAPNIGE
ncbi:MAG: hypothetical protein FWE37_05480 [Spirochaetaceae bacterium]|nr:hypothetical protein [Spirochaetaceae bacterium]